MTKKSFLSLFLALTLAGSAPVRLFADPQELDPGFFSESENSVYRFAENLPTDASTVLIKPEAYVKNGVWAEDRFLFPGTKGDTDLLLGQELIGGKPVPVIQFQAYGGMDRTLRFERVIPTARLIFYFRVARREKESDRSAKGKDVSSVYLSLYAGQKLVDRLRLTVEDGWVKKTFSLSTARFLKKKLKITLDIKGDDDNSVVSLFGYTL